ncbi:hypothetical protein [Flavilitoribacter nigricans]|uniref:Uncharacterized protein n=1 Tax=Flavilitoribacter nigricans (strain ATCC 23147 / DSM 23189 / NBRC 102662 / NCIMB 1420 / SS-2) TaxID=1122177 RepID=A0A2D0N712_FLAN2|nr:hypothetical protein [Flavilitoribacter nigricans]PHN04294.1 hypothetical protein CRP01_22285 [Flavilitoribacter nigricans DSM 23189 = NBRC 102662]
MKYLAILPLLLITAVLWSQPIDNKRMKRDIEVAENILLALIEDASTTSHQGFRVEGTYLESYGLLFTVQRKFGLLSVGVAPAVIWDGNRAISGRVESRARGEARTTQPRRGTGYTIKADSAQVMNNEELRELSETFLADYGYLLTQLPDNEKICIKYSEGQKNGLFGATNILAYTMDGQQIENASSPGFTMTVSKKAVEDHRTGKIDRNALISRIEYTENKASNSEEDRELVLLNSIFQRAYQRDLSDGFFMRGGGNMERIPGLGVIFSYRFATKHEGDRFFFNNGEFKFYFPNNEGEKADVLRRLELDEEDVADEEAQEEPDFEEFLEDFKANVVEYGSTVRKLNGDEVLSFELSFPSCDDCDDRPEQVKITAKQSLLERYRTGGIDLDEAIGQLQVSYRE